jgi:hypothetical protein
MGFAGPVWHASAAPAPDYPLQPSTESLRTWARAALEGVGDAALGEWEEWSGRAYHVRRRLSAREQRHVGQVRDIRGSWEAEQRLRRVQQWLPVGYAEV